MEACEAGDSLNFKAISYCSRLKPWAVHWDLASAEGRIGLCRPDPKPVKVNGKASIDFSGFWLRPSMGHGRPCYALTAPAGTEDVWEQGAHARALRWNVQLRARPLANGVDAVLFVGGGVSVVLEVGVAGLIVASTNWRVQ